MQGTNGTRARLLYQGSVGEFDMSKALHLASISIVKQYHRMLLGQVAFVWTSIHMALLNQCFDCRATQTSPDNCEACEVVTETHRMVPNEQVARRVAAPSCRSCSDAVVQHYCVVIQPISLKASRHSSSSAILRHSSLHRTPGL